MENFLQALESLLIDFECESKDLKNDLEALICSNGKRVRPRLAYLLIQAGGQVVNTKQMELIVAGELLHTASLIHDDIIDNADERRSMQALHKKYDSKLAVIAGDLLAAVAIEKIQNLDDLRIRKMFLETFKKMCNAEIVQYFSKNIVPDFKSYMEKTKNKTALLFSSILQGVAFLSEGLDVQQMHEFGLAFGIAFQLRNDLKSFLSQNSNDRENGVYTAPDIFINQGVLKELAIEKTEILIDNEKQKMINILKEFDDNIYRTSLLELVEGL